MFSSSFDIENQKRERNNNAISAAVAVGIHALLLLLFLWFTISLPNPPFQEDEGGMAINFGTSDVGEGDVQPMNYTPTQTAASEENSAADPTPNDESIVTQDEEDAPAMKTKKEPVKPVVKKQKPAEDALFKSAKNTTKNTQKTKQPVVDDNSLFRPGAQGTPNNSKGDGEGKGKGDQGDPNGDPNSRSYTGGGSGNGTGTGNGNGGGNWKLAGRRVINRDVPKNPCEEKRGRVNITIKVNQSGKVIDAKFTQGGSTTDDECLVNIAVSAAKRYTFDAKSDATEVQTGSILFTFKEN
ncbi:MAG TPA: hypothetical protein VGB95_05965 [Chitinophagales bacterium]